MSGFSVADLIKPTLTSLNTSKEKLSNKEAKRKNLIEKNTQQSINTVIINSGDNNIHAVNSYEEHKKHVHRTNSIRNHSVKKSRTENNCMNIPFNVVSGSEIASNSFHYTSQINYDTNNIKSNKCNNTEKHNELLSPMMCTQPMNAIGNLSNGEMIIQPIINTYSEGLLNSVSSQQVVSNDSTFLSDIISSSSPLCTIQTSGSFGHSTDEQLQILLKLHNLFGITGLNKVSLNSIDSISSNTVDNKFCNQLFPNSNELIPTQNSFSQNDSSIQVNPFPEMILPLSSSDMISVVMNSMLTKERTEEISSSTSPSSSSHQTYSNHPHYHNYHHYNHQQQQAQLHHQQPTEINSQLTIANRNLLIANILKSRFLLDNNCGQNIFPELNEVVKFDNSSLSLSCYDNFIKNSLSRNVSMTSDNRKPKRIRTAFSPAQLFQLESAFEKNHYVVGQERKDLASDLNLTETQVKVWFQNRRTKYKRLHTDGKDILSEFSSKDQRSLSLENMDEEDEDNCDDNDGESNDVEDNVINGEDKEGKKDNLLIESIHSNQLNINDCGDNDVHGKVINEENNSNQRNIKFTHKNFPKHDISKSSKGLCNNPFSIQNHQSLTETKQLNPSKECQQYLISTKATNHIGDQKINDLSDKSKLQSDYTKYSWNFFKQIHDDLMIDNETKQNQSSISHSSQHLLNSVIGHINQNLNHLQHSCSQTL